VQTPTALPTAWARLGYVLNWAGIVRRAGIWHAAMGRREPTGNTLADRFRERSLRGLLRHWARCQIHPRRQIAPQNHCSDIV
jgi:hypothetical protein